ARAAQMGVEVLDLPGLLAVSDFVTVHMPKTPETIGMISTEEFKAAKPGARFINVARGGIIDEEALAEAIATGRIGGAGIDVWNPDPPEHSALMDLDAVNVTPHLGASTATPAFSCASAVEAKSVRKALAGDVDRIGHELSGQGLAHGLRHGKA